jgi:hypothetical protein
MREEGIGLPKIKHEPEIVGQAGRVEPIDGRPR